MATSNDPTLVVSSKPCQSAQTSKTSEHAFMSIYIYIYIYINIENRKKLHFHPNKPVS